MIDSRSLLDSILQGLTEGVGQSLEEIANEARRRAPVRRLFKGGGRSHKRFVAGQIGVGNHDVVGRPYMRTTRVGRTITGETIRGRTNSAAPVTSPPRGSGRTPIGGSQFREVARSGNGFRFSQISEVRDDVLGRALSDVRRGRGLRLISRERRALSFIERDVLGLGARGAVRENFEYGGTLRDSIEVVGPRRTPLPGVMGYVKASAVEHGFNYAYAQEFGTAHNAPQPFMRPALRNSLRKITTTQKYAIKTHLERSPRRMHIKPMFVTIRINPIAPALGVARFNRRLDQAFR